MIEDKLIKKAAWAYYHFIKKNNISSVELDFEKHFAFSWEMFNYYATFNYNPIKNSPLKDECLYLCWHFPEYPLLLKSISKNEALILVADDNEGLLNIVDKGKIYNFRDNQFSSRLVHSFKKKIPIICMFDYCYSASKYIYSDFLGYPSKTPYGIIKLARLYNYQLNLVVDVDIDIDVDKTHVTQMNIPNSDSLQATIDFINKKIETKILEIPSRWLLWPSIDNRWQNVNYE